MNAADSAENFSYKLGQEIGKELIKVLIDLYLATKLWNAVNTDTRARIFTIIRSYLGLLVNLVWIVPLFSYGFYYVGLSSVGSMGFYVIGLLILLHGKQTPSNGRVKVGWLCFFLFIICTILTLVTIQPILSNTNENQLATADLEKSKVASKEFVDFNKKVKVVIPNSWQQYYAPDFPGVDSSNVQMVALSQDRKRGAKLFINLFHQDLTDTNFYITNALNETISNAESILKSEDQSYKTISISSVNVGKILGKRLVYERNDPNGFDKIMGHIIVTMDYKAAYTLEIWCDKDDYMNASNDFLFFESNFTLIEEEEE